MMRKSGSRFFEKIMGEQQYCGRATAPGGGVEPALVTDL
jgi:hypothetical protein